MRTIVINTVEAEEHHKWAAFQDAHLQNSINKTLYTDQQIAAANAKFFLLQGHYSTDVLELNYRKTLISIKVGKPFNLRNRKELRALETMWAANGIKKKESPQGITYVVA